MRNILFILSLLIFFISCKEDFEHEPEGSNSSVPAPVKNAHALRNTPGGAVLTYEIPDNLDIQYVKAEYTASSGEIMDVKASSYVDTLVITGLGDTKERNIKLYTVNRMEKVSAPVEVTINPLTPPIVDIRESLTYSVDFGGFLINFENVNKQEVAICVLARDEDSKEMLFYDALYTSLESGVYAVRGLPNVENDFGIFVRDRWDNISDTLYVNITPWREDYLDKKKFTALHILGDVTWSGYTGSPNYAFDDDIGHGNFAHTEYPVEFPHRYTLDLGVSVNLSRFKMWQRPGDDLTYQHGAPKYFKIYGRADDPGTGNADNPLEGWTLLRECHSFKPSGLPVGQNSSEDIEYMSKGEEYTFPLDVPEVRYIRFEMLESWSGMQCSVFSEISFWGDIKD